MSRKRGQQLLAALDEVERELRLGARRNEPVSLILLDTDDLESYGERNGQQASKKALATIRRLAGRALRETDSVIRLGREDFSAVLTGASKENAFQVAERVRRAVEEWDFPGEDGQPGGRLTASLGVASFPADAATSAELVGSADRALYLAKVSGKNRVQLYDTSKRARRRRKVELHGDFNTVEIHHQPLKTVDISPIGLKFTTERELPVGALIDLSLQVPGADREVKMAMRVLRCSELKPQSTGWILGQLETIGGRYEIAARTLEIGSPDLRALSSFLWGRDDEPAAAAAVGEPPRKPRASLDKKRASRRRDGGGGKKGGARR